MDRLGVDYRKNGEAYIRGGKFWTSGFYVNMVRQYSNEEVIREYVKNQGMDKEYRKVHSNQLNIVLIP